MLATLLAVCAPMWLGPGFGALLQTLGAHASHTCACGMAPGKCGCPECARLEETRKRESAPRPYPVLKSTCDDDSPAQFAAVVAPGVLGATFFCIDPPFEDAASPPAPPGWISFDGNAPPKPPPKAPGASSQIA
jgi:hypothetical protein